MQPGVHPATLHTHDEETAMAGRGTDPGPGRGVRPSGVARDRYAAAVGAEVGHLRRSLREALDEAERHEAAGRPDLAVEALESQRELLALVHARLGRATADAAVEAEAESVLADAERTLPVGEEHPVAPPRRDRRRGPLPQLAGAVAAALLGAVALLGGPVDQPTSSLAGSPAAQDAPGQEVAPAPPAPDDAPPTDLLPSIRPGGATDGGAGGTGSAAGGPAVTTASPDPAVDGWLAALTDAGAATVREVLRAGGRAVDRVREAVEELPLPDRGEFVEPLDEDDDVERDVESDGSEPADEEGEVTPEQDAEEPATEADTDADADADGPDRNGDGDDDDGGSTPDIGDAFGTG